MASLYDKLLYLNETKGLIREAIEDQDVQVPDDTPFREYAEKIAQIKGKVWSVNGQTGDVTITIEDLNGLSKEEIEALIQEAEGKIPSLDGYAKEEWVLEQDYATNNSLNDAKSELETSIDSLDKRIDDLESIDHSLYETKENANSKYAELEGQINAVDGKIDSIKGEIEGNLEDYVKKTDYNSYKEEVGRELDSINQEIDDLQDDLVNNYETKSGVSSLIEASLDDSKAYTDKSIKDAELKPGYGIKIENKEISVTLDTEVFKVVTELPQEGQSNKIYLVPSTDTKENDVYDEYAWINDEWEKIGERNVEVDLTGYYTKEKVDELINAVTDQIPSLDGYAKEEWVQEEISKIDVTEQLKDYIKEADADKKYGTLTEQQQLRSDIEQALGEIAEVDTEVEKIQDSLNNFATKDEVNGKQDTLISGTNLKTINGESILGSGNLEIESGGLTPEQDEELKSLRNDVEQALGEIAELGADKQNKLIGNYLVKFEQNGGMIDFTQRGFDGLSESTKSISFKTINGQNILGQGDLKIESGGGSGDANIVTLTQKDYDNLKDKDKNTLYAISDADPVEFKTINGKSILGKGDITIEGGSGSDSPFEATDNGGVRRVGNTKTLGSNAFAENDSVTASGTRSHAEGANTTASGDYSHAEGLDTVASGMKAHAEGQSTKATGTLSHTEGISTTASNTCSHAEGSSTKANGYASHAEGMSTTASNYVEHAGGTRNISTTVNADSFTGDEKATLFSIGNGNYVSSINSTVYHNAFEIKQNGDIYIPDTNAEGEYYEKPMIKLQEALKNSGSGSDSPFEATDNGGVRRVGNTKTLGSNAFAENDSVTASGNNSHAEGYSTTASSTYSHAEGFSTIASGKYSHAEGSGTKAYGENSHAEGNGTTASGRSSHAEGGSAVASGKYSHAEGVDTEASNYSEHASGKCNKSTLVNAEDFVGNGNATLFSVGNGYSIFNKHNALEIKQNGDIYIPDTSAEGEYFEKPMIHLQEALKNSGGSSGNGYSKEEADEKFANKPNIYEYSGYFSRLQPNNSLYDPGAYYSFNLNGEFSNFKIGDIIKDKDKIESKCISYAEFSSSFVGMFLCIGSSSISFLLEVVINKNDLTSASVRVSNYNRMILASTENQSSLFGKSLLYGFTLTQKAYDELAKKTDLPDTSSFATNEYVDSKLGDINNILENILG